MNIVIQKRRKYLGKRSYFYEYRSLEIEEFRWEKKHQFSYVPVGSCRWFTLENEEELVGMNL